MSSVCRQVLAAMLACLALAAFAVEDDEDGLERRWVESTVDLPLLSSGQDWMPFYVSAVTENSFFVDGKSLSVGVDGVVRYMLLVRSPSGVRNVTFEGMRCETRERRQYASGRADGTWAKSRADAWVRIRDELANRHHAALFLDYFCPGGVIARSSAEIREALRRDAGRW